MHGPNVASMSAHPLKNDACESSTTHTIGTEVGGYERERVCRAWSFLMLMVGTMHMWVRGFCGGGHQNNGS